MTIREQLQKRIEEMALEHAKGWNPALPPEQTSLYLNYKAGANALLELVVELDKHLVEIKIWYPNFSIAFEEAEEARSKIQAFAEGKE